MPPALTGAGWPAAPGGGRGAPTRGGGPACTQRCPPPSSSQELGGYFSPLPLPHAVVGTVALSVPTVFDRRLPEFDALEVRARRVCVVPHAGTLLDLFHVWAGLRICRRLTEGDRLLGLHLRARYPVHPFVGAVRMLGVRCQHPRVGPAGRPLDGDQFADGH